jgi:hypothetical protein
MYPRPKVDTHKSTNPITIVFFAPKAFLIDPLKGAKIIYANENIEIIKLISLEFIE